MVDSDIGFKEKSSYYDKSANFKTKKTIFFIKAPTCKSGKSKDNFVALLSSILKLSFTNKKKIITNDI